MLVHCMLVVGLCLASSKIKMDGLDRDGSNGLCVLIIIIIIITTTIFIVL